MLFKGPALGTQLEMRKVSPLDTTGDAYSAVGHATANADT